MDWLANITLPYIIAAVTVLFIARVILGKYESAAAKSATEIVESALIAVVLVFLIIRPFVVQAFYIPSGSMRPTLLESDHILVNKFVYRFHEPQHGDIVVFKSPPGASNDGVERDFIKRLMGTPGDVIHITPGYVMINGAKYDHMEIRSLLMGESSSPDMITVKLVKDGAIVDGKLLSTEQFAERLGQKDAKGMKIVPGVVYRNGKALVEPYTQEDPDKAYPDQTTNPEWLVKQDGLTQVKIPNGRLLVMGDNRNNSNDARFWGPSDDDRHYWGLLDRNRIIGKALVRFWPLNRLGLPR
jgi:signal peptidase I